MALADISADVRRLLGDDPFADTITTAPSPATTGTTISFGTPTMWEIGAVADILATGEQVYIQSGTTNPYTIVRQWNDTDQSSITTSHIALKDPRFGTEHIEEAAARQAERLWPGVYEVTSTALTYDATSVIYNLPTDYETAVDLVQLTSGSVEDVTRLHGWREMRNVPTGIAAAGKALRITSWPRTDVTATLFYRAKPTTATTDVQLQHLIALGAAIDLLLGESAALARDVGTDEIQVQEILRAAQFLTADFTQAKSSYASTLHPKAGSVRRFIRNPPTYAAG